MKTITMGRRTLKFGLSVALLASSFLFCNEAFPQKKKYPYLMNGDIIVCREGNDGVKRRMIHPNWTTTPAHNELEIVYCNFAAKFQVKFTDTNDQDGTKADYHEKYCVKGGWRLPTIRELLLISAFAEEMTMFDMNERYFVQSATIISGGGGSRWAAKLPLWWCSTPEYTNWTFAPSSDREVEWTAICVRDL